MDKPNYLLEVKRFIGRMKSLQDLVGSQRASLGAAIGLWADSDGLISCSGCPAELSISPTDSNVDIIRQHLILEPNCPYMDENRYRLPINRNLCADAGIQYAREDLKLGKDALSAESLPARPTKCRKKVLHLGPLLYAASNCNRLDTFLEYSRKPHPSIDTLTIYGYAYSGLPHYAFCTECKHVVRLPSNIEDIDLHNIIEKHYARRPGCSHLYANTNTQVLQKQTLNRLRHFRDFPDDRVPSEVDLTCWSNSNAKRRLETFPETLLPRLEPIIENSHLIYLYDGLCACTICYRILDMQKNYIEVICDHLAMSWGCVMPYQDTESVRNYLSKIVSPTNVAVLMKHPDKFMTRPQRAESKSRVVDAYAESLMLFKRLESYEGILDTLLGVLNLLRGEACGLQIGLGGHLKHLTMGIMEPSPLPQTQAEYMEAYPKIKAQRSAIAQSVRTTRSTIRTLLKFHGDRYHPDKIWLQGLEIMCSITEFMMNHETDQEHFNAMLRDVERIRGAECSDSDADIAKCVVCWDKYVDVILLPCKHACLCSQCLKSLRQASKMKCPKCRAKVKLSDRIYI